MTKITTFQRANVVTDGGVHLLSVAVLPSTFPKETIYLPRDVKGLVALMQQIAVCELSLKQRGQRSGSVAAQHFLSS